MPRRLVRASFASHEGHISRITQGSSGARFAPAGRPSRTQKCDAYCHNFMRPRRSTRPTIVTEISASTPVFPFQVPYSLNFYSYFFKFCRILFYEMHNYAEYYSKTHKMRIKYAYYRVILHKYAIIWAYIKISRITREAGKGR